MHRTNCIYTMTASLILSKDRMRSVRAAIALCIIMVAVYIAVGCTGQRIDAKINSGNISAHSNLPIIYTAPIGGFEVTDVTLVPNTTFETNYTFHSRNWGPGEVNYSLSAWYMNGSLDINRTNWCCPFLIKQAQFKIEPSTFFVEPNHSYTSRVSLTSDTLPKEFFSGVQYSGGGAHYSARLNISVRLGDNSTEYADDQIFLQSTYMRPLAHDILTTENCSVVIKRGEKKHINISYLYYSDQGLKKINFTFSQTPLNTTIIPSDDFLVKHQVDFPAILTISAGSHLPPGEYPVDILINGNADSSTIHCKDTGRYYGSELPLVNVTVV
jgi:hypothetical protein